MQFKQIQGKTLRYMTAEPDDYDPNHSYPIIIMLHGRGASMGDLAGLSSNIDANGYVYIFPNAPLEVQFDFGVGYVWVVASRSRNADELRQAGDMLSVLFDEVMEAYDAKPGTLILGGFSQGGAMTYYTGLPRPDLFKGLIALSSHVPDQDDLRKSLPADRNQPIFVSHGTADRVLPVEGGRESRTFLESEGYAPEYQEYNMGHEITQGVLNDLTVWIHKVLPPAKP